MTAAVEEELTKLCLLLLALLYAAIQQINSLFMLLHVCCHHTRTHVFRHTSVCTSIRVSVLTVVVWGCCGNGVKGAPRPWLVDILSISVVPSTNQKARFGAPEKKGGEHRKRAEKRGERGDGGCCLCRLNITSSLECNTDLISLAPLPSCSRSQQQRRHSN